MHEKVDFLSFKLWKSVVVKELHFINWVNVKKLVVKYYANKSKSWKNVLLLLAYLSIIAKNLQTATLSIQSKSTISSGDVNSTDLLKWYNFVNTYTALHMQQ